MTSTVVHRLLLVLVVAFAVFTGQAAACPFCSVEGRTLTKQIDEASLVVYGKLANAKLDAAGDFGQGTTDLILEDVVKPDPILGDNKVVTLPRYLPTDEQTRFVAFCDVFKGRIDVLNGITVKSDSGMVKYLKGALAAREKDAAARLLYFFDYLDNPDPEVSSDAYKEFGYSDYADFRKIAAKLPADKVARWLQDPETPVFRLGLYGSMLGHCGAEKHADVLRKVLDDPRNRLTSGVDGILAGYAMLKPKDGWKYMRDLFAEAPKDDKLTFRYAALRAVRFFWEFRPDVVDKNELVAGVAQMLDDPNMADLVIDDLRKWRRSELLDRVLGLYGKPSHDTKIVQRAIIRFALACPESPKAAALVANLRKQDPELVKDQEQVLHYEAEVASQASKAAAASK